MGQIGALFYKYLMLSKRQKAGLACQIISPLLGVILIKIILWRIEVAKEKAEREAPPGAFGADGVIPSAFYISNMITPKWEPLWGSLFSIRTPARINNVAFASQDLKPKFESWTNLRSGLTYYEAMDNTNTPQSYPLWRFTNSTNSDEVNNELIVLLKKYNEYSRAQLRYSEDLPDSFLLVKNIDQKTGIDASIQVNNVAFPEFHRLNGMTYAVQKAGNGDANEGSYNLFITESGVGVINLMNNLFLQSHFENDFVGIVSVVSKTLSVNLFEQAITSVIAVVSTNIFPVSLCLGFPIMLFMLTMEKEEKVKSLLDTNGLKPINYWIAFFVYYFIILEVVVLSWLLFGKFFVDFTYFTDTALWLNIWFFSAWNLAQISFSLFTSSFLKSSDYSTLVGYQGSIFLILILCLICQFLFPNPSKLPIFLYILPQTALVRFVYLGLARCIDFDCYTKFSDIQGELFNVFFAIHFNFIFFTVVGLILNEPRIAKKLDCRQRRQANRRVAMVRETISKPPISSNPEEGAEDEYRMLTTDGPSKSPEEQKRDPIGLEYGNFDKKEKHTTAIEYEQDVLDVDDQDKDCILLAKNLNKTYPCSQGVKKALTNFTLSVKKGQIFGLLGPNGAGKTTFLSIVTGTQKADSGDAWICNSDVQNKKIQSGNIGFCPQFDILWPSLNVYEHFMFMAMFKGIPKAEAQILARQLIEEVDLEDDWQKMAQQLSGGMKRRCSMGMALIGDPKIVFLDEPSSGLDPVKRRHFWQLIQKITKERAVLLTTHLMEEADTLCNQIGIITSGKLRCIGNSLSLKSIFTKGLKLQVVLDKQYRDKESRAEFVKEIQEMVPGIEMEEYFQGTMQLVVKKGAGVKLSYLFEVMMGLLEGKRMSDWSVSLGSLEDVFLNVVRSYREDNIVKVEKRRFSFGK